MSKKRKNDLKNSLKTCNVCGFGAYTKEDLEFFSKAKNAIYGRRNLCKKCENEWRKTNRFSAKRRKKLIEGFIHPITCYFCNEEIIKLNGQDRDSLAIHSLDGNHENWDQKNKASTHHICHAKHHSRNLFRENNPNWKGGFSLDYAKYKRLWRKRRREATQREYEQ